MLGVLADVAMVGAAQLFRTGSPLLAPANAAAFFDALNACCNWLSAASFLSAALGTWLAARSASDQPRLDRLHLHFGAIPARHRAALRRLLRRQPLLADVALVMAVIGIPLFAAVWVIRLLRDMKNRISREQFA